MRTKPYETVVHMFTIFFYVLMSLALKEILTSPEFQHEELDQKWPCFVAAVFLFSRFLFGSSSHLYAVHADENPKHAASFFTIHLFWIMVFALLGTGLCFAHNVHEFLWRNVIFGAITLAASVADLVWERRSECPRQESWARRWVVLNGLHTAVSLVCVKWYESPAGSRTIFGWSHPLVFLAFVLAILLAWDFIAQIGHLTEAFSKREKAAAEKKRAATVSPVPGATPSAA